MGESGLSLSQRADFDPMPGIQGGLDEAVRALLVHLRIGFRLLERRAGRRGLKPRITHILKDAVPVERLVTPVDVGPGIEELLALLRQRKNAHAQGILVAVRHLEHIHVA